MKYDVLSVRSTKVPYRVTGPKDIYAALKRHATAKTERFLCITLNGAHEIVHAHLVTVGLVNRTLVHPREVLRPVLLDNACAFIVAHNHPSNHLEPSPEDLEITQRLREASMILGLALLDHLVIGRTGYLSFVERGLLSPDSDY
jgi:DNA repair protein RadC